MISKNRMSLIVVGVFLLLVSDQIGRYDGWGLIGDIVRNILGIRKSEETKAQVTTSTPNEASKLPLRQGPEVDDSFEPKKVAIVIRAFRAWIMDVSVPQPIVTEKTSTFLIAQRTMRENLWSRYLYFLYHVWLTEPERKYVNNVRVADPKGLAPASSIIGIQDVGDLEAFIPLEWRGSFTIKGFTPQGVKVLQTQVAADIRRRLQERVPSPSFTTKKGLRPEEIPNGYVKEADDFLLKWWDGIPKPLPVKSKSTAKKR